MNKPRYYAQVYGPRTTGAFGSDSLIVESPADVTADDLGNLIITEAARPASETTAGHAIRDRKARIVMYPKGDWRKVVVGEIQPRALRFEVDLEGRLERPNGVWPEAWNDLLHALSVARVTGSQGTRSETLIEGRGRQAFTAIRRRTIHDGTRLVNARFDVEQEV